MSENWYGSLVAQPDSAESIAEQITSRAELLKLALRLTDEFIQPAGPLLSPSDTDPSHLVFDLKRLAKSDFSGLLTGLLARAHPGLQQPPSDKTLSDLLESTGFEIASADNRRRFYQAWIATRAGFALRALLARAGQLPRESISGGDELRTLGALSERLLPGVERSLVEALRDSA